MNATIPVIADVHQMSTDPAIAIEDIEFPQREISVRRPMAAARADLHALMRSLNVVEEPGQEVTPKTWQFLATWRTVDLRR